MNWSFLVGEERDDVRALCAKIAKVFRRVVRGSGFPDDKQNSDPARRQLAKCGVVLHAPVPLYAVVRFAPRAPAASVVGEEG